MTSINFFNRKHFWGLVLALVVGFITIGPQLIFIWQSGGQYQGIYMLQSDAEPHYLARMREAVDGNGIGNPFFTGFKTDIPVATPAVIEQVAAWPSLIFGVSVPLLNLAYKFIWPALMFLLVYFLSYRLTSSIVWSLAGGALVTLGYPLLDFGNLLNLIKGEPVFTQFLMYARPINPQISGLFFFGFLHVLLSYWRQGFNWRLLCLLAVILLLSFYVYFYLFTYLLAILVINAIVFGFVKRRRDALGLAAVLIFGVIGGLPVIYELFKVITHPDYYLLAETFDVQAGRRMVVSTVFVATGLLFAFVCWRFKKNQGQLPPEALFIAVLLTTSLAVVNQQLITGIVLQEGHYHWYFNRPVFSLVVVWAGTLFFLKSRLWVVAIGVGVIVLSIYAGVFVQYSSYLARFDETIKLQNYGPVLNWISDHTPAEKTFLANQALSELIPVYTGGNVVWEDHASYYLVPKQRRDFTVDNILTGGVDINAYPVDYVIWDRQTDSWWPVTKKFNLKPVADISHISIYEVLSQ